MARIDEIVGASARRFDVGTAQILGKQRCKSVADARIVAMALARAEGRWSYPELGRLFKRDQSTVRSACICAERRVVHDPSFRRSFEAVRDELRQPEESGVRFRVAV